VMNLIIKNKRAIINLIVKKNVGSVPN